MQVPRFLDPSRDFYDDKWSWIKDARAPPGEGLDRNQAKKECQSTCLQSGVNFRISATRLSPYFRNAFNWLELNPKVYSPQLLTKALFRLALFLLLEGYYYLYPMMDSYFSANSKVFRAPSISNCYLGLN